MNTVRLLAAFAASLACASVHADVTVQEQTTLNVAIIKAHGTTTKRIAADKERTESEFHCDGIMSMLCGKNDSLQIVRLDRDVILSAEPKKKSYTETPFPTPEQRRALEERMQAGIEKMKSCPTPATAPKGVDTSKCQMSPPVMNVTKADDIATFAGHASHHTILTMTQSCANKETGDECEMAYTFDVWLANDDMPELADRRSFDQNYVRKLGLGESAGMATPAQFSQFLAPYKDAIKKLGSESGDLKGYPLKTTFRVAYGGAHCAAAANAGASKGGSADGAAASGATTGAAGSGLGGMIAGSAAGTYTGKLLGGLFSKKKKTDEPAPTSTDTAGAPAAGAPAAGAPAAGPPAAGAPAKVDLTTIAEFTVETTAISNGPIAPDQFEMPAEWKKIIPQEQGLPEMPSCPKTGS